MVKIIKIKKEGKVKRLLYLFILRYTMIMWKEEYVFDRVVYVTRHNP